MPDIVVYTDGGARGNPGPAACAAVLVKGGTVIAEAKKYLGEATNNFAEYQGLILGLTEARKIGHAKRMEVRMDSELIVRQMRGEYRVKEKTLKSLHEKVRELLAGFPAVHFVHVRREENSEADRLVNEALDESR